MNFGVGPYDRIQNVLNIQPVIPVHLNEDWNLIIRWITPIVCVNSCARIARMREKAIPSRCLAQNVTAKLVHILVHTTFINRRTQW